MDTKIGRETEITKDYIHRMVVSKNRVELRDAYESVQAHLQTLHGSLYLMLYEMEKKNEGNN